MNENNAEHMPERKTIRIKNYDYSSIGAYFITICASERKNIFWASNEVFYSPENIPLTREGKLVEQSIKQINEIYSHIVVDKYCIMPDHIHLILFLKQNEYGQKIDSKSISSVVGQMKRWVSKQIGNSIWQRSFIDRVIRNEKEYKAIYRYIHENPVNMDYSSDNIDFVSFGD